jgi:preprotein translocase subunit SecE
VAEKPVKTKATVKVKTTVVEKTKPEKPKAIQAKPVDKAKEKTQPKQPNRVTRWWRETLGELRKVSWPTIPEARRMTWIVLGVMASTAVVLGLLDFIFSKLIGLLVKVTL